MPKFIKHYIQNKYILSYKEKNKRKEKMEFYLKIKKKKWRINKIIRIKSRDKINGSAKAYYSFFGLSRHSLKKIFNKGILPGLQLSSW